MARHLRNSSARRAAASPITVSSWSTAALTVRSPRNCSLERPEMWNAILSAASIRSWRMLEVADDLRDAAGGKKRGKETGVRTPRLTAVRTPDQMSSGSPRDRNVRTQERFDPGGEYVGAQVIECSDSGDQKRQAALPRSPGRRSPTRRLASPMRPGRVTSLLNNDGSSQFAREGCVCSRPGRSTSA